MEDIDKEETTSIRGIDWEVVSLTASAYAAAPGPMSFDTPVESKSELNKDKQVASTAMFMSSHFIFPPHEHKNLLMEPDCNEIQKELGSHDVCFAEEEHGGAIKDDEDYLKLKSDDALRGIQFFDQGRNNSDHGMEFGEGKQLEDLTMVGQEQDIYDDPSFSAFGAKTGISQSVLCNENAESAEPSDPSPRSPNYLSDYSNDSKPNEEKFDESGLPCEAWWKRHALSLYNHAKEANTFWSVFVAAAVMGFVILGQRWHKEKLQLQKLEWLTIGYERLSQPLGPISRLKEILVGGHQRTPMIHGHTTSNHLGV